MLPEAIYKQKEGILCRKLSNELMLYDEKTDKVHILNENGALVWELLNEENCLLEIEKTLIDKYPDTTKEEISRDINEAIEKLLSEGLIICK